MEIKTVGVVGGGTMGSGIVQQFAQAGYKVIMARARPRAEIERLAEERGLGLIKRNLSRQVERERLTRGEADAILGRIQVAYDHGELAEVDLVIEAIVEIMAKKKEFFSKLDRIVKPEAILASNTSGLSITEIASATGRSGQVIGMHFFNPVPVMKLVEVVRGTDTSDSTFNTIMELAGKIGKEAIAVNEAPLFVVNRLLIPMINEAAFVLQEGISSAEDIDRGMRLGANHPIGPLALGDLVGLDVVLMIMDNLHWETRDSKYRASPLIRRLVRAGRLGRKTGRGFYDYKNRG
ncbi:MAG: NAD(P)-binding domain-containing protein [Firmicutes bacterium]|nr:NAD(P)-binding domain-containing protein [Bacillota bacterium]